MRRQTTALQSGTCIAGRSKFGLWGLLLFAAYVANPSGVGAETLQKASVVNSGGTHLASPGFYSLVSFGEPLVYPKELTGVEAIVSPGYIAQVRLLQIISEASSVEFDPQVFVNDLRGGFPNPASAGARIRFSLAEKGEISLVIYDVSGRLVRTLTRGTTSAGHHEIRWDGKRENGLPITSGVYFVRLVAHKFVEEKKLVVLK